MDRVFDRVLRAVGNRVLELCPRWLVFVQGVGETPGAGEAQDTGGGVFWGENIYGARAHPLELSDSTKLIYAPCTYGPSTFKFPFFECVLPGRTPGSPRLPRVWAHMRTYLYARVGRYGKFPNNMPQVWQRKFGFVEDEYNHSHPNARRAELTAELISDSFALLVPSLF